MSCLSINENYGASSQICIRFAPSTVGADNEVFKSYPGAINVMQRQPETHMYDKPAKSIQLECWNSGDTDRSRTLRRGLLGRLEQRLQLEEPLLEQLVA